MKKQKMIDIEFKGVYRGTKRTQKDCIAKIQNALNFDEKRKGGLYKVGFSHLFDWYRFPTWFSIYNDKEVLDGMFYKEKGSNVLKAQLETVKRMAMILKKRQIL